MYALVTVTQLPSIDIVNLFNELSRSLRIKVFFRGETSGECAKDFISAQYDFDQVSGFEGDFEEHNVLRTLVRFRNELHRIQCKMILTLDWDLPEFLWGQRSHLRSQNLFVLESTVMECRFGGAKVLLKRFILGWISTVFASRHQYEELLRAMNYCERFLRTYGAGIIHLPGVVTKSCPVAIRRAGGVGQGLVQEILREFDRIKRHNSVAPSFVLDLIHQWSRCKELVKTLLGKQSA